MHNAKISVVCVWLLAVAYTYGMFILGLSIDLGDAPVLVYRTKYLMKFGKHFTRLPCSFHHYADFGWNNLVYCAQTQQTHPAVHFENETSQKRRGDRQDDRFDLHGFLLHACFSDASTQLCYNS